VRTCVSFWNVVSDSVLNYCYCNQSYFIRPPTPTDGITQKAVKLNSEENIEKWVNGFCIYTEYYMFPNRLKVKHHPNEEFQYVIFMAWKGSINIWKHELLSHSKPETRELVELSIEPSNREKCNGHSFKLIYSESEAQPGSIWSKFVDVNKPDIPAWSHTQWARSRITSSISTLCNVCGYNVVIDFSFPLHLICAWQKLLRTCRKLLD